MNTNLLLLNIVTIAIMLGLVISFVVCVIEICKNVYDTHSKSAKIKRIKIEYKNALRAYNGQIDWLNMEQNALQACRFYLDKAVKHNDIINITTWSRQYDKTRANIMQYEKQVQYWQNDIQRLRAQYAKIK